MSIPLVRITFVFHRNNISYHRHTTVCRNKSNHRRRNIKRMDTHTRTHIPHFAKHEREREKESDHVVGQSISACAAFNRS